jgi:hypothetical protein
MKGMTIADALAHNRKVANWREWPNDHSQEPATAPPAAQDGVFSVSLPIRLVNVANAREHWRERRERAKAHRDIAAQALPKHLLPKLPVTVTITRFGPKFMDSDGNVISAKSLRDGIASQYCVDDSSHLIEWKYGQEKGEYGVRVEIESR